MNQTDVEIMSYNYAYYVICTSFTLAAQIFVNVRRHLIDSANVP